MSIFEKELKITKSIKTSIECYRLPRMCYKQMCHYSIKHFKDSDSGIKHFPDPTYFPNKLKLSYQYRKGIFLKLDSQTSRDHSLQTYFDDIPYDSKVIIHVAYGRTRFRTKSFCRMRYLMCGKHTYRVPYTHLIDDPKLRIFQSPTILFIEVPLVNNMMYTLNFSLDFHNLSVPNTFIFLDCKMVEVHKSGKNLNSLASIAIINEDGDILLNTLVNPVLRVRNYGTFITEKKLKGKLDERVAISRAHKIIASNIIVGCSLRPYLDVLKLKNIPKNWIFDIETSIALHEYTGLQYPMQLKEIAEKILNKEVKSSNSALEDVQIILDIFNKYRVDLITEFKSKSCLL